MTSLSLSTEVLQSCRTLWEFLSRADHPSRIEVLVVLGSMDLIVPAFAASLAHRCRPRLVICSGGLAHQDDLLNTGWKEPEAVVFARVLSTFGVSNVVVETQSTNTGDNIRYSREAIIERGVPLSGICFVHKPYMALRTRLTAAMVLEGAEFQVVAPAFSFDDYAVLFANQANLIDVMVGDFERILIYPQRGYMAHCDVPGEAVRAFELLKQTGYSRHLLQDR